MSAEEYKKNIANNIKQLLAIRGISQAELARRLSIPKQTVNNWTSGLAIPRMNYMDMMCAELQCTRRDILDGPSVDIRNAAIRVPVYGRIAAGIPLEMITDINDYEELDPKKFNPEDTYFALTIHGDSMEPKMSEGDVVIVRAQDDAESGDICIVSVNGMEATCKRIRKHPDGLELIALNPSYGPMFYTPEQCRTLPVRIRGKVVELRAKF